MKGIVLAGGLGTRLAPLTNVTNKCLLPVYDRPMIYWPIQTLINSGIDDILLVCGGNAAGEFLTILGNGKEFGLNRLHYTYQPEPKGIADALALAEEFAENRPILVILADNIFENSFSKIVSEFKENPVGGRIFLTQVKNPQWYGCAKFNKSGDLTDIVEKPKNPPSNWIVTGLYMYDSSVWQYVKKLTPSARGELEITDINKYYLSNGNLKAVNFDGYWGDAGESIEVYNKTCNSVRRFCKKKKKK